MNAHAMMMDVENMKDGGGSHRCACDDCNCDDGDFDERCDSNDVEVDACFELMVMFMETGDGDDHLEVHDDEDDDEAETDEGEDGFWYKPKY